MKVENILTIVDIESTEFYPEFLKWLRTEINPIYSDNEFKEDIYNIDSIIENQEEADNLPPMIDSQLKEIKQAVQGNNAGYFRITYH